MAPGWCDEGVEGFSLAIQPIFLPQSAFIVHFVGKPIQSELWNLTHANSYPMGMVNWIKNVLRSSLFLLACPIALIITTSFVKTTSFTNTIKVGAITCVVTYGLILLFLCWEGLGPERWWPGADYQKRATCVLGFQDRIDTCGVTRRPALLRRPYLLNLHCCCVADHMAIGRAFSVPLARSARRDCLPCIPLASP